MFEYINLVLIIIIIIVLIVDTVYIFYTRRALSSLQNTFDTNNTLVDLREFKDLDNEFKNNYKTLFADSIMPVVNMNLNEKIKESEINTFIKNNKDEIMAGIVQMKNMGIPPTSSNNTDTSKE